MEMVEPNCASLPKNKAKYPALPLLRLSAWLPVREPCAVDDACQPSPAQHSTHLVLPGWLARLSAGGFLCFLCSPPPPPPPCSSNRIPSCRLYVENTLCCADAGLVSDKPWLKVDALCTQPTNIPASRLQVEGESQSLPCTPPWHPQLRQPTVCTTCHHHKSWGKAWILL